MLDLSNKGNQCSKPLDRVKVPLQPSTADKAASRKPGCAMWQATMMHSKKRGSPELGGKVDSSVDSGTPLLGSYFP